MCVCAYTCEDQLASGCPFRVLSNPRGLIEVDAAVRRKDTEEIQRPITWSFAFVSLWPFFLTLRNGCVLQPI